MSYHILMWHGWHIVCVCLVSWEGLLHGSWAWLHWVQFTRRLGCYKSQRHEEKHLRKHRGPGRRRLVFFIVLPVMPLCQHCGSLRSKKGSPYSIAERRIPVLGSQPAGDVSHKPDGRLPLLSARPPVTPATLKRAATNFAACWTEAQWVWTVCLRLLPDSIAAAIWTRALLRLSPAC